MVKLGSDPHVQVHIQVIVVSDKWTGHCSTRNNVHHWGLNLKKQQIQIQKRKLTLTNSLLTNYWSIIKIPIMFCICIYHVYFLTRTVQINDISESMPELANKCINLLQIQLKTYPIQLIRSVMLTP